MSAIAGLGFAAGVGGAFACEGLRAALAGDASTTIVVAAEPRSPSDRGFGAFRMTAAGAGPATLAEREEDSPRFGWLAERIAREFSGRCGVRASLERDRVILAKLALRRSVFVRARGPSGRETTVFCDGRILEKQDNGAAFVSHPTW
ncbi:MAG: hypothetical protein IPK13_04155 [Deltaproteobacteria bacterium]|nr:hypothetical protein [Deltaproteobacteria bacterium]